jgi:RNA polymerase sigma-70 factor (ECF subfamily)
MLEEAETKMRALIAGLPPRQAEVFCLAHFEELSHDEIAESLQISVNAVSIALYKARFALRSLVNPQSPGVRNELD